MTITQNDYSCGHPWFYVLGGAIQSPKAIIAAIKRRGYKGYREDEILSADNKPEPQRSEALRRLKENALKNIRSDMSRYREVARELSHLRRSTSTADIEPICHSVHTNMSLKYCHLFNHFAHLIWLEELLSVQSDLFA